MSRTILKGGIAVLGLILAHTGIAQARTAAQTQAIVVAFNNDAFVKNDVDATAALMSADFIEHHPPQGLPERTHDEFLASIRRMGSGPKRPGNGPPPPDMILVSGNYVLFVTKMSLPDPTAPGQKYDADWFDLFRVNAAGKVAEHWDSGTKRAAPAAAPAAPPAAN